MSKLSAFIYSQPEVVSWRIRIGKEKINASGIIDCAVRYYMNNREYLHIATLAKKKLPLFCEKSRLMIRYQEDVYEFLQQEKKRTALDMSVLVENILSNGIRITEDESEEVLKTLNEVQKSIMEAGDKQLILQRTASIVPETPKYQEQPELSTEKEPQIKEVLKKPQPVGIEDSIIDALMGEMNIDIS